MSFYVGQKVVCIEAQPLPFQSLQAGALYTVKGIHSCNHGNHMINVGVASLAPNWTGYTRNESCGCRILGKWHGADRFRPLLDASLEEQVNELEEQPVEA